MVETSRKEIVEALKEKFPEGTRVELVHMSDAYREMPVGLKGVVRTVDDAGTIHVKWENGSTLGAVYGEDIIKRIHEGRDETDF